MAAGLAGGRVARRGRGRRRPLADINVTPMVDVMLVLLVVFMVTAPLLTTGVAVDLPEARTSPLPGQDEPLTVTIRADGSIWLQESAIGLDELGPRLAAIKERNADLRIFVRGDRNVDYGRIMAVVSALHGAGIRKVALVTEAPRTAALDPAEKAR